MRNLVTFVTVCKGRLKYLKQTLGLLEKDFHCVLVDYACPDNCAHWCSVIRESKTSVLELNTTAEFNLPRAFNMGAQLITTPYIGFIDCDVLVYPEFAEQVNREVSPKHFVCSAVPGPGMSGFVVCPREAFKLVGGYDEEVSGYGYDDVAFKFKLQAFGLEPRYVTSNTMSHIEHSDELRTKYYSIKDIKVSRESNKQVLTKKLEILNKHRSYT